jgi:hypothetical protein
MQGPDHVHSVVIVECAHDEATSLDLVLSFFGVRGRVVRSTPTSIDATTGSILGALLLRSSRWPLAWHVTIDAAGEGNLTTVTIAGRDNFSVRLRPGSQQSYSQGLSAVADDLRVHLLADHQPHE